MAESKNNSIDHFIRQRRNLVLISLFIIFFRAGELTLNKINFLGNEIILGNSNIVTFSLGLFFLYFLWRYYTSCNEVDGIKKFKQSRLSLAEAFCLNYLKIRGRKKKGNPVLELTWS